MAGYRLGTSSVSDNDIVREVEIVPESRVPLQTASESGGFWRKKMTVIFGRFTLEN